MNWEVYPFKMLSSLRQFPGTCFEGNQRISSVHHWCISMEALLLSHTIRKEIFSLSRLLFSVLICTEFAVKVRLCWWEGSCRAFCPVSVFSSFGLAVPSLSLLFLAVHTSWQQVTQGSRWHRTAGDTRAGNDAMEATTCCTCGRSRRCWSQYYKPKPQAL